MSKIALITLVDFDNYGNRLQNYALEKVLKDMGNFVISIVPYKPNLVKWAIKKLIKRDNESLKIKFLKIRRLKEFLEFDNHYVNTYSINSNDYINIQDSEFDYFISGSDQVWNPDWADYTYEKTFLRFCRKEKRIAYAASFGVDSIPKKWIDKYKIGLSEFQFLSVREDRAVEIVESVIGKKCVKVLDPTMLLGRDDWDKIAIVPHRKDETKYILTYFLGGISDVIKKDISIYAEKFNYNVINLLDLNDSNFYDGPDKFVGLISKADLVLTDSFHATVFSILYEKPFVVYGRQGIGSNMGSRLSSLLEMCGLSERKCESINKDTVLECNFELARKAIVLERKHSMDFLKKSVNGCVDSVK